MSDSSYTDLARRIEESFAEIEGLFFEFAQQPVDIIRCVVYNRDRQVIGLNLILHTVKQEKQRIEYMLAKYQSELSDLPKGTISEKMVGEKTYYYLKYRDGKKVVSQYVSKKEIENVRALVEKRRHIEAMVKSLQEEKAIADKVLEGAV